MGRKQAHSAKMGRPREFSEDAAVEAAMRVFWEKGYEGTSLDDLTAAMGINRSSLYSSFGDKESLFRRVISRYSAGYLTFITDALNQLTARDAIEALWRNTVKFLSDPTHPRGCLSLQGGMTCGSGMEKVRKAMIDWRKSALAPIEKRMQRARKEGDLPADVNPLDLARYVLIVMNGLSIQAANGASLTEMNAAVDLALRSMSVVATSHMS
jgi:AcrR family transcriptional regulator